MGCGCNKVRTYSQSAPLVLGEPNGEPPVYVRSTVAVMSMRAGSEFWVTGDGLAPMLNAGWLVAE